MDNGRFKLTGIRLLETKQKSKTRVERDITPSSMPFMQVIQQPISNK